MTSPGENSADARRTADQVLRRDRRRIRSLAMLCVGLWVLSALLIASVYLPIGAKMKHYSQLLQASAPAGGVSLHYDPENPDKFPPAPLPTTQEVPAVVADLRRMQWITGQVVVHEWIVGAIILTFALATGLLASGAAVALALTIRRVTLRQVSEQLAQISEQLRQMQRTST